MVEPPSTRWTLVKQRGHVKGPVPGSWNQRHTDEEREVEDEEDDEADEEEEETEGGSGSVSFLGCRLSCEDTSDSERFIARQSECW